MQERMLLGVYDQKEMNLDVHLSPQKATAWTEVQTQERVGCPLADRREAV